MKTALNRFKDRPATRLGWWGFGLGMAMIVWVLLSGFLTAVVRPWLSGLNSPLAASEFGIGLGFVLMFIGLGALICNIMAMVKGERSWAVWVGLLPVAMLVFMIVGDLLTVD